MTTEKERKDSLMKLKNTVLLVAAMMPIVLTSCATNF
jgi:hypothetical protein